MLFGGEKVFKYLHSLPELLLLCLPVHPIVIFTSLSFLFLDCKVSLAVVILNASLVK